MNRKIQTWMGAAIAMTLCFGAAILGEAGLGEAALGEAGAAQPALEQPALRAWAGTVATVNGAPLFLAETAVNESRTWTSRPPLSSAPVGVFVLEGQAEIAITYEGAAIESAVVRPLSLGIAPEIDGDTLRFTLEAPAQVAVEINGQTQGTVHLFAMPPETDIPDKDAENVLYFGPGLWETGRLVLESGQTLYLAEGAVLRGSLYAEGQTGIAVLGRGIIDGSTFDRWPDAVVPIDFSGCSDVRVEGVTILDPAGWTLNLYHCKDVAVDWVNIIAARSNSDGITVQSCEDVRVEHCFVRGWDDNLVVKGYEGDAKNITFENCILWTDLAQSCEIGYETRAEEISHIAFRNITVLHANHKPVLSIHNSDSALVRDVVFEDITVEDCHLGQGDGAVFLIDLTTTKSQWSKTPERGNIRDVTIRNVKVLEGEVPGVRIFAFSKDCTIDDVHISGLTLMGESIHSFDELRYTYNRKLGKDITLE